MTRERIEDIREIVMPFVSRRLKEINYENLGDSDAKEFERDFNEIVNLAIKALEQEPKTGWIPVSERLPEKNIEVLSTTRWDEVTIAERFSNNDWFIHEGNSNADMDEIKAWMPLPEPYKESEDKE